MLTGSEASPGFKSCASCVEHPSRLRNKAHLEVQYTIKPNKGLCKQCCALGRVKKECLIVKKAKEKDSGSQEHYITVTRLPSCDHTTSNMPGDDEALELQEDYESLMTYQSCTKNPDHKEFKSINAFTMADLKNLQDPDLYKCIKLMASLTVMLKLETDELYKNDNKLIKAGSGSLYIAESQYDPYCPCDECKDSEDGPKTEYRYIRVTTALHVVGNDQAKRTKVLIDFDNDRDRKKIQYLTGHLLVTTDENADRCILECITHDVKLHDRVLATRKEIRTLERLLKSRYAKDCPNFALIISHPHGVEKKISFGQITEKTVRTGEYCGQDRQRTSFKHNVPTCQGSSGAVLWILGLERVGYMDHMITDHTHSAGQGNNDNNSGEGVEGEFPNIVGLKVQNVP